MPTPERGAVGPAFLARAHRHNCVPEPEYVPEHRQATVFDDLRLRSGATVFDDLRLRSG